MFALSHTTECGVSFSGSEKKPSETDQKAFFKREGKKK